MSLRQPRPIKRDAPALRDDRLFIIACDDRYAPDQYFNFFRIPRIQVHVVPTEDGDSAAKYVLDRLLEIECDEDDERWLLLDTDHCTEESHFPGFVSALEDAQRQGIKVALSKPCFEFWLLLHKIEETEVGALPHAKAVEARLRQVLGGSYNKCQLRAGDYPLRSVGDACVRAARLDATVGGGHRPDANTSRVYKIWHSIVEKALPSQLPLELQPLKASQVASVALEGARVK